MINIGIVCPSDIALRRFLPALQKISDVIRFVAIGIASPEEWFGDTSNVSTNLIDEQQSREYIKALAFTNQYGGKIIVGYENLVREDSIDAVYIPLPPALHYQWALKALKSGKHVFVEKPATTELVDTDELIKVASIKSLALHENYMFIYHNQLAALDDVIRFGEIGDVRLYRISFGYPLRQICDFRYNQKLGGGAFLDAGGYCMKYANYLLGGSAHIVAAQSNHLLGYETDMYGSATLVNDKGSVAQISFGMDNDYRCDIEIWGSKGTITSGRIFTAPAGFVPSYTIKKNQEIETRNLPVDDAFCKSILRFVDCINESLVRKEEYAIIHSQAQIVEQFKLFIRKK